jgi:hypothetical protein
VGPRRIVAAWAAIRTTAWATIRAAAWTAVWTTAWTTIRTTLRTARSAPTKALSRAAATRAALAGTRRTRRGQDLHLLGREDLFQLGLGLFFQCLKLLLLFFTEVQLFHHERR